METTVTFVNGSVVKMYILHTGKNRGNEFEYSHGMGKGQIHLSGATGNDISVFAENALTQETDIIFDTDDVWLASLVNDDTPQPD